MPAVSAPTYVEMLTALKTFMGLGAKDDCIAQGLTPEVKKKFADATLFHKAAEISTFVYDGKWNGGATYQHVKQVTLAFASVYLKNLLRDFSGIANNYVRTFAILSLFASIGGLAGLIYRRNFWAWFLLSFATLFVINNSGWFGKIPGTEHAPMPLSAGMFVFFVSSILALLITRRLRRYSNSLGWLSAAHYNWLLFAVLILVGIASYKGWGPWLDPTTKVSWLWSSLFGPFPISWFYKPVFWFIGLPFLYTMLRQSTLWTSPEPKTIVVCLDGTSQTPEQFDMGHLVQTNVFKLFGMLKSDPLKTVGGWMFATQKREFDASICKRYSTKQISFYYSGVGNKLENNPITQLFGGAMGSGASAVMERAYLDVMRVYRPGDRIAIFGFSRGAAIARMLARAIDQRRAPLSIWTIRLFGSHWTLWQRRRKPAEDVPVPIAILGCWDTVGSFGVAKTIAGINFQQVNMGIDLTVPDNVEQAYHMVALDEQRDSFVPTLMDPDPFRPGRIVEVWFSGDHAGVGGGWATENLSDVTLDFLLTRISSGYARDTYQEPGDEAWGLYLAAANGLNFSPDELSGESLKTNGVELIRPDPLGQLRHYASMLYQYSARKLPLHAVISDTVFERMTKAVPVYAPQALFDHTTDLVNKRQTIETEVGQLQSTNSLPAKDCAEIIKLSTSKLHLTKWLEHLADLTGKKQLAAPAVALSNRAAPAEPPAAVVLDKAA